MATQANSMAAIAANAQAAIKAAGITPTCVGNVATTTYTINPKKPARCGNGNQGNAAHWAGIASVLEAKGGKATGAELLQGSIAGNPNNIGNAWPFLRYAINSLEYLVATK